MDPLHIPDPAITLSKPKLNPKVNKGAEKMGTSEPQIQLRQNRVFGTARSINIIEKPTSHKASITKPKICVPRRQPKPIQTTKPPFDTGTKIQPNDHKKTPENVMVGPKLNKKSDAFILKQKQREKPMITRNNPQEKENMEPKTPAPPSSSSSSSLTHGRSNKAKVAAATPFYTAVHCSKCRFDRLETASYWIGQIKMAESVGKHSIAADFFRLALDSHAEPIRNLRIELRRYLLRNGYLSEHKEWREVAARYGILKLHESNNNTSGILESSSTESSSSNTCTN